MVAYILTKYSVSVVQAYQLFSLLKKTALGHTRKAKLTSLTVAIYVIEQMHTSHFCSFLGKQNFREMVGYRAPETLELLLWDV